MSERVQTVQHVAVPSTPRVSTLFQPTWRAKKKLRLAWLLRSGRARQEELRYMLQSNSTALQRDNVRMILQRAPAVDPLRHYTHTYM